MAKATLTDGLLADGYQKVREHFKNNVSPELHASAYVGVRDRSWAGPEFAGKYLDICSQFYRNAPEAVFLDNAKRVIGSILKEQRPDGDLSAVDFSDGIFWVWNQAFTLYGMLSYYRTTKEAAVLQAAEKCAQGIIDRFSGRGISTVLDTVNDGSEHLVIMLPFSMLYAITGKDCYADFVRYLIRYLETTDMDLVNFTDILQLRSKKGIEMLLAFLGLLHFGVQIGNSNYIAAADRYFRQVYERQIGPAGNGTVAEFWTKEGNAPAHIEIEKKPNETCVAVGFVELALALFEEQPDSIYLDAVEKSLFNHILGAMADGGSDFGYYQGNYGVKVLTTRSDQYSCCRYRASDLFAHLPEILYYQKGRVIIPRIYVSSVYENEDITIRQKTAYPKSGDVQFSIDCGASFTLRLRVPGWCHAYLLRINGVPQRPWRPTEMTGQRGLMTLAIPAGHTDVSLELIMEVEPEKGEIGGKSVVSFHRGPLLLVADSRLSDLSAVYDGAPVCQAVDSYAFVCFKTGKISLVDYASAARKELGVDQFLTWIPAEVPEKKLVCIGDSLTEGDYGEIRGVGCVGPDGYPSFLARMLSCHTVNMGKCGWTTADMLSLYQKGGIDLSGADGVILMLGTNRGLTYEGDALLEAYRTLISACVAECGRENILLCVPPRVTEDPHKLNYGVAEVVKNIATEVPKLAEEFGLHCLDLYHMPELGEQFEDILQPNDGLHFAAYGYHTLATIFAKAVRENLPAFRLN